MEEALREQLSRYGDLRFSYGSQLRHNHLTKSLSGLSLPWKMASPLFSQSQSTSAMPRLKKNQKKMSNEMCGALSNRGGFTVGD